MLAAGTSGGNSKSQTRHRVILKNRPAAPHRLGLNARPWRFAKQFSADVLLRHVMILDPGCGLVNLRVECAFVDAKICECLSNRSLRFLRNKE